MSNKEDLKELVQKLTTVLEADECGCFTWHESVHRLCAKIGEYGGKS